MTLLIIMCAVLTLLLLASLYLVYNLTNKVEFYEANIGEFYSRVAIVLHSMRAVDEKQMFENDDEVGSVFQQLNDILSTLRPLIYGITDDQEEN